MIFHGKSLAQSASRTEWPSTGAGGEPSTRFPPELPVEHVTAVKNILKQKHEQGQIREEKIKR